MTDAGDAVQETPRPTVFVVDADASVRENIQSLLRTLDVEVMLFESAEDFLEEFNGTQSGCLITEACLPGISGIQLFEKLKASHVTLPVIFLATEGDVPMAVRAMKSGALDFIEKPFVEQAVLSHVRRVLTLEPGSVRSGGSSQRMGR